MVPREGGHFNKSGWGFTFFVVIVIAVAVVVAVVAYNISTKGSSFLLEGAKVWSQQKTGQSASRGISKAVLAPISAILINNITRSTLKKHLSVRAPFHSLA